MQILIRSVSVRRSQHAPGRRGRTQGPLRGDPSETFGQPLVQRQLPAQREGRVHPCGQVGRRTHPRQPLPHYCLKTQLQDQKLIPLFNTTEILSRV